MNETRMMGSGAHGERPQAPQAEQGVLHKPLDGRRLVIGGAEVAAFRAELTRVRREAAARIDVAENAYATPAMSPQAADAALQRKFDERHVIIPGTPEGDRARQLRDQRSAQSTQRTGGVFSRVRSWFR